MEIVARRAIGVRAAAAATCLLVASACSKDGTTGPIPTLPQPQPPPPPSGTVGSPASVVGSAGDGQTATAGSFVPVRPQVRVTDLHGNVLPGVSVSFAVTAGGGSATGTSQTTGIDGRATVGGWILGVSPGSNELTATLSGAGSAASPVTFTATGTAGGAAAAFDVEVRYNPGSSPTSAQATAFAQAEARWESVIIGDLVNTAVSRPAGTCTSPTPIDETIDDLVIFVTLEPIDGPGGTLGSAGPCLVRSGSLIPVAGQMRFDTADLAMLEAGGTLREVVAHEMGHVLGVGTLWSKHGFLTDPAQSGGTDPHFNGPLATAAFEGIGGSGYNGAKVPVENLGGPGTVDGHWRESVLGTELMTGWVNYGSNPLSEVTARSLADMGYSVDPAQADGYRLSGALIVPAPGPRRPPLQLVNDVWRVPIGIVSPTGRLEGLIRH